MYERKVFNSFKCESFDSHIGFPKPLTTNASQGRVFFPKHSAHGITQQPAEEVHVYLTTTEIPCNVIQTNFHYGDL